MKANTATMARSIYMGLNLFSFDQNPDATAWSALVNDSAISDKRDSLLLPRMPGEPADHIPTNCRPNPGAAQGLIFSISWAVYTPTSLAIRIAMYNCPNSPANMAKLRAAALTGVRSPNPTDVRAMKLKYSNTA